MPFIEDENGLAIYFTREQWQMIYRGLDDHANWCYCDEGTPERAILKRIRNMGWDDE